MSGWSHVYVVFRIDPFETDRPDGAITIKEVLPTAKEAEKELRRLNSLMPGCYFCQVAKHYPQGRGGGGTLPTTSTKS